MTDLKSQSNNRLTQISDFLTGNKTATVIPFSPDSTKFPSRKDVPRREDAPEGAAWVWGADDYLGRVNLLTPARVAAASKEIKSGQIILTFLGTKGEDIKGPEENGNCGIHHWAQHGIAGRGVLIDYWTYANEKGMPYDPYEHYCIPYFELYACGKAQGIDIRPASQGGDILIGDILFIRSGFISTYYSKTPDARAAAVLRPHGLGAADGQRWAGIKQEDAMLDWLHDCYFAAVAGDAPSFEAWPSHEEYMLHEYILAFWGMPLGRREGGLSSSLALLVTVREELRVTGMHWLSFELTLMEGIYSKDFHIILPVNNHHSSLKQLKGADEHQK
ncbi:hypothetical protein LARI1_G003710 [Lachnellula arida]|uniref:Cyclase n=1 Tax=Lachnellula arida TaxID=1316785 RepID=A0A8T9BFP3_9HELO|nr:hypothetical protein LARI1_G003710 [Lachnellula arida]